MADIIFHNAPYYNDGRIHGITLLKVHGIGRFRSHYLDIVHGHRYLLIMLIYIKGIEKLTLIFFIYPIFTRNY